MESRFAFFVGKRPKKFLRLLRRVGQHGAQELPGMEIVPLSPKLKMHLFVQGLVVGHLQASGSQRPPAIR